MTRGPLQVVLAAVDDSLADAWERHCGDLPGVTIHQGSILEVECDAVVSPANSFGFMDGGIDGLYLVHFGSDIQHTVQRLIANKHGGELLVGDADIVETGSTPKYLIVAPTMRVPMKLRDSVNPYLAARAIFRRIQEDRKYDIRVVAIPGLGTGTGGVSTDMCARQLKIAFRDVMMDEFTFPDSWAHASERHQLLYTDHPKRLQ